MGSWLGGLLLSTLLGVGCAGELVDATGQDLDGATSDVGEPGDLDDIGASHDGVGEDDWRDAVSPVDADASIDADQDDSEQSPDLDADDGEEQDQQEEPPETVDPPPQKEVFFNIPGPDGAEDLLLEQTIKDLVNQATPGSSIFVSYFTWTRVDVAEAFGDAYDRGVHVQVIVGNTNVDDGCVDWAAITTLKERLGPENMTVCRECQDGGGCIGDGINHNKFIILSELDDGSRNIVVQSSANLTKVQRKLFNNLVVIRDDPKLFNGYKNYWLDLRAQKRDLSYYSDAPGSTGTKAYFFPRSSGDTIYNILGNINCAGGGDIRIAMGYFTGGRINIAERLADKQREGCNVQVMIGELDSSNTAAATAAIRAGGAEARVYPETNGVTVHSKYLLIDANYLDAHHRVVWTGSHNYTKPSLRNHDEVLLKIEDDVVYDAYLANWTMMHDRLLDL